jgi:aspartyl-tRNA(Asn)/glutamyl-tRNA(Gln) amidotransferase subunit A
MVNAARVIARLNPGLNAFAVLNPRALETAGASEARWRVGRPLGLLDGCRAR